MKINEKNQNAIIAIYGAPKTGKTFSLATALPLGNVLHISAPGEGNAGASLQGYKEITQLKIENYRDLMVVEGVLLGRPAGWQGDNEDQPVSKLAVGINQEEIDIVKAVVSTTPTVVAIDGLVSFQCDIFGGKSIEFWKKDTGVGRYGDIADMTRLHLQRFAGIAGVKMIVLITQDQQITDKGLAGIESTNREMAFEGRKSREIISPMCDFILPIFDRTQLGEAFPEWTSPVDPAGYTRTKYFPLVHFNGYVAGGRIGFTKLTSIPADLTYLWDTFYNNQSKEAYHESVHHDLPAEGDDWGDNS